LTAKRENNIMRTLYLQRWDRQRMAAPAGGEATVSDALRFIDTLEFARNGLRLESRAAVAEFARLTEQLFDTDGMLDYRLEGGRDARERPRLKLSVSGEIHLKCQRCLGRLPYDVEVDASLLVLTTDAAATTDELDDLDGVPADGHADVLALVEDEVLLAIPYAARHPEGECAAPRAVHEGPESSAFAALEKLRRP
jgi:uncharacterized protein